MPVDGAERVYFFVLPVHYKDALPEGYRIQSGAMNSEAMKVSSQSSGPSVFIVSKLPTEGLKAILAHKPKWIDAKIFNPPASEFTKLGINVEATPDQTPWENLRVAHASLVGATADNRDQILRMIETYPLKAPSRGATV